MLSSVVPTDAGASVEQLLSSSETGQFLSSAVPAEAGASVVQLLSSCVPAEAGASKSVVSESIDVDAVASALASTDLPFMERENLQRAMLARANQISKP